MASRASLTPDEGDFERWIEHFRGPLVGLLASWGSDWRQAEELAADCFAQAWVARERFVGNPESLLAVGAWLRGIAFKLHASSRRAVAARASVELDFDPPAPGLGEHDERRELLAAAFVRLPVPQQTVLRMHYLEETSAAQVAALLGLSVKAVEDRLYQARRALRELVERERARAVRGVRT